ncbi:hypothetical protein WS72_30020 [Burkholderia savannae]|uniref:Uncharacterized protein n=1 Tax=Burkholderia savannae TaxID=1637837 RepID=A0ABR5T713_9BURK|nr:hypothetical protein WS72_30020 [Burkholderia savannae]KWZ48987.1 hypothetical protein WS73_11225 [Burkholderia savannae]
MIRIECARRASPECLHFAFDTRQQHDEPDRARLPVTVSAHRCFAAACVAVRSERVAPRDRRVWPLHAGTRDARMSSEARRDAQ